jgi:hypothetical protein
MRRIFSFVLAGIGFVVLASGASAGDSPAAASCLAAAAKSDHDQTITLCTKALEAEPENEQVKQALQTAQAAKKSGVAVSSPPPPSGVTQ